MLLILIALSKDKNQHASLVNVKLGMNIYSSLYHDDHLNLHCFIFIPFFFNYVHNIICKQIFDQVVVLIRTRHLLTHNHLLYLLLCSDCI